MSERINIEELMAESGVKFGTSGARGLVVQMTDRVCAAYAQAFLEYLHEAYGITKATPVAVGGDRRPSTPRIMRAVAMAAARLGHPVEICGLVPSPAVALRGLEAKLPSIMVTGSHIPDDRNGIKFNTPAGEVTKADEVGMKSRTIELPELFDDDGMLSASGPEGAQLPESDPRAIEAYKKRYLDAFADDCLKGSKIAVYGHSAVGRDFYVELYRALGAEVTELGFSETFVPVDTEAIRPEDVELARKWSAESDFDAIFSSDGDSDRPIVADEKGEWVRGDVAGVVTARFLNAQAVATPVSCNTAVEKSGFFERVIRTRIGSPFVIAGMEEAKASGASGVVGYEANGGFLTATEATIPGGGSLAALPTRDAVIVHLAVLLTAKNAGKKVSEIFEDLPERFTASDRDQSFAQARSAGLLQTLRDQSKEQLEQTFGLGKMVAKDETDGLRFTFQQDDSDDEVVHLRPSGNAPELRCYAESVTMKRSVELVKHGLKLANLLAPAE